MLRVKLPVKPPVATDMQETTNYRQYTHESLEKAYKAVICQGISVKKASRQFSVPYSTLQDRTSGRVNLGCVRSGPEPVFSLDEEKSLMDHITTMSSLGYGYTRAEVTSLATDLAIRLGKKTKSDPPFSLQWYYNFKNRWPDIKQQDPQSFELMDVNATPEEVTRNYFEELNYIMKKYDLQKRPEAIYNISEKGIMGKSSSTTTVIGCVNALGMVLPPYFIFKGQKMREKLLKGGTAGTAGTVTETGWSNSEVFERYIKTHFLRYAVPATKDRPVLLLYDGHTSHVSMSVIEWAQRQRVILFVLPPQTSENLKLLDVGCFIPFEKMYNDMREKHLCENVTFGKDGYSVCEIACEAYNSSLNPCNIQASFRTSGIYPFEKSIVDSSFFIPSTGFSQQESTSDKSSPADTSNKDDDSDDTVCARFLKDASYERTCNSEPTKKRKVLTTVVGDTEDHVLVKIIAQETKKQTKSAPKKSSPKPSTSGKRRGRKRVFKNDSDSEESH